MGTVDLKNGFSASFFGAVAGVMLLAIVNVIVSAAGGGTVQVLGAWEGSETDNFLAVVAPFEAATGIDVIYVSTRDLRGVIDDGLANGTPPDVSGLEGPAHMAELAERGALIRP